MMWVSVGVVLVDGGDGGEVVVVFGVYGVGGDYVEFVDEYVVDVDDGKGGWLCEFEGVVGWLYLVGFRVYCC